MIEYICDGCGKKEKAEFYKPTRHTGKPEKWFSRADDDGEQHACSRECIEVVAKKSGKTDVIIPI